MTWEGISIEVRYCPQWLAASDLDSVHVEVESADRRALPITETGYKSHFTDIDEIDNAGGAVTLVMAWLSEAGQSDEWKRHCDHQRQGSLF